MADKDLNEIIQALIDALNNKLSGQKTTKPLSKEGKEIASSTSELEYEKLQDFIKNQERWSEEIKKNTRIAEDSAKNTIDSEQIINELKEERIRQITEEYRQNQLILLQLRKKLDDAQKASIYDQKAIDDLKAKIKLLEDETKEQAKLLEGDKKEKELKEGILSIVKQTWEASKQYGLELEKHIIAISKSNGAYAGLLSNLREAGRLSQATTLGTGITGEENMRALEALSDSFIGLTTYSAQSISNLQVATAQLTKVGVSSTAAAKGFDSLVLAMGKTPEQAAKIEQSFVQMAAKNRLALNSVSQAFAENSSRFVGYGEQMTKVLDGLAEQSLKTGIAINKLVGIAQGFDTFEDASRKVGNLNALLGGDYFNSVELLTATDEERIRLLKEGVSASGMQWESMNRFQKMAIANAAGISDLNEAAKMFGQTSLQNTRQQADQAEVQKTLAEQANLMSPMMDKLKSSFNGLYIAIDPFLSVAISLVEYFGKFLNLFVKAGEALGGSIGGKIAAVIVSLSLAAGFLAIKNSLLGASWNFIANSISRATARLAEWKAINTGTGEGPAAISSAVPGTAPVSGAAGGFLSNAGNMLKAAGSILLFAAALFVLAKALQEFSDPKITGGGIGLAVGSILGMIAMSYLLQKAAPNITSGSILIAIIAGSLLLLGLALQMFSKVDWKLVAGIGVIILGLGLAIAGFGLAVSGPQGALLAIGIGVLIGISAALTILGVAIKLIVDSIKDAGPAFTNLTDSLAKLFEIKDLKENFSNLESFFSQLSSIDVEPINNLANAIYNLATNLEALAAIPSKMGINVTGKTDLTETINKSVANAAEATTAISKASTAATTQALIPTQQTITYVPLVVQIDKKNILNVLSDDIKVISKAETLNIIDGVGISQSAQGIQDRLSSLINR